MSFERAVEFVLRFEGGYVNDPNDSGGATNFGISQRAFPDIDVASLTRDDAKAIYRAKYWDFCKCDQLPEALALILMDSAVNQGPAAAVRMLQRTVGVREDGVIGQETISAIKRAALRPLIADFIAERAFKYARHPKIEIYGLGWYRRLAACHQMALE